MAPGGQVAAVCGKGVHVLDPSLASGGQPPSFRLVPGVLACSAAFDSAGYLWMALASRQVRQCWHDGWQKCAAAQPSLAERAIMPARS
jgi:hypothetical protein